MLDFKQLVAPATHGGVLVVPEAAACARIARENAQSLNTSEIPIRQRPLRELRAETRHRLGIDPSKSVVVVGHQPDFIHAGVWAKNIFAHRLARTLGGEAIHVVVDCDAPKRLSIRVPAVRGGRWAVHEVPMGKLRAGCAYEQIQPVSTEVIDRARKEIIDVSKQIFSETMLAPFFDGVVALQPPDWVNQIVSGRKAIESSFDIYLTDVRVSKAWWSPLAAHLLLDPGGFAAVYNRSLAEYRAENKVHEPSRPIPDLLVEAKRIELPFWLYRDDRSRARAFATTKPSEITLLAGSEAVVTLSREGVAATEDVVDLVARECGWLLRPRALMTTIWARLFVADLFVHGIGGAKYDRISDKIIESYFHLPAPDIACVTATMYLHPACNDKVDIGLVERELRDATWNPQRHLRGGDSDGYRDLLQERGIAVKRAEELARSDGRHHEERQEVFREIRRLNEQIHAASPQLLQSLHVRVEEAWRGRTDQRVICDREYFFALHARKNLERLLDALPGGSDFVQ